MKKFKVSFRLVSKTNENVETRRHFNFAAADWEEAKQKAAEWCDDQPLLIGLGKDDWEPKVLGAGHVRWAPGYNVVVDLTRYVNPLKDIEKAKRFIELIEIYHCTESSLSDEELWDEFFELKRELPGMSNDLIYD